MKALATRRLPLAVLAAAVLAAGGAACGGSDDDGDGASGAATRTESDLAAGGGENGNGGKSAGRAKATPTGPALHGDRAQARTGAAAVEDVYKGLAGAVDGGVAATDVAVGNTLAAADGNDGLTGVCELMSEQAKRETIVYARRSAGLTGVEWTCQKAMGLLLRRTRQGRGLERTVNAEVIGVNADGDRATATVRFGREGPLSTIPLVREDGRWKLGVSPGGR